MHPDLALRLVRTQRVELDRAARLWVRDHPRASGPQPSGPQASDLQPSGPPPSGPARRGHLSFGRFRWALAHLGVGRPGIAAAPPV